MSFSRTWFSTRVYKITDTALSQGYLLDLNQCNPKDKLKCYVYDGANWYLILNLSSLQELHFNCGNGGRIYMVGLTTDPNISIRSENITCTQIIFVMSYGTIRVYNSCLDNDGIRYHSFDEVLTAGTIPSSYIDKSNNYLVYHDLMTKSNISVSGTTLIINNQ